MNLVSQYWRGVLRRLQAELEDFNRIIGHMGEMGRENEQSLARILENLVPARYGIGSGLIFDADGNDSKQTDIVIFNAVDEPAVMAQTNQVLFPIENVLAAIEIKTTVDGEEVTDIGEKVASLRALSPRTGKHPLYAAVAYKSSQHLETIAKHINNLKTEETDLRPDIFLVVEPAMIGLSAHIATELGWTLPDSADYLVGVAALQQQQENGKPQIGLYATADSPGATIMHEGNSLKAYSAGSTSYVAESSRALLLFCEALLTTLATIDGRDKPGFHHYISEEMRDLLPIKSIQ
jgi:hypothetical protein